MPRRQILVHGDVQGVGFRWTASRKAAVFGIDGWVKNCPDGTVMMEIEGNVKDLDDFLNDLCYTLAVNIEKVDSVDIPEQSQTGFEILRG